MPSFNVGGLVSGLDTDTLVQQLLQLERRPMVRIQQQRNELELQRNAWRDVNTRLKNLQGELQRLMDPLLYRGRTSSSSDTGVLTAEAGSGAADGGYDITVHNLAVSRVMRSSVSAAAPGEALGLNGTFNINGIDVTVDGDDSLSSLAEKINALDEKVQASVLAVTPGSYELVLTGTETGTEHAFTLDDPDNLLQAVEVRAAADASLTVNGITVTRSENSINDVIDGVELVLKKTGDSRLEVRQDLNAVVNAVKRFVDQFNSTYSFIEEQIAVDPAGNRDGLLRGDSSLRAVLNRMRQVVTDRVEGLPAERSYLFQIGLSMGGYGTSTQDRLVLDEAALREALEEDLTTVARLFGAEQVNVAAAEGSTAVAYDELGAPNELDASSYAAANAIDGYTRSDRWGAAGGGWSDATPGVFPDYLEINFGRPKSINRLDLYTIDSGALPAEEYGIRDYGFEYWDGSSWVELLSQQGNTQGYRSHYFDPVLAGKVRLRVDAVHAADGYSRLVELEVYEENNGILSSFNSFLSGYLRSGSGVIPSKQEGISAEMREIDQRLERMQEQLVRREESLRAQFTALEKALGQLQNQSNWLAGQIASLASVRYL